MFNRVTVEYVDAEGRTKFLEVARVQGDDESESVGYTLGPDFVRIWDRTWTRLVARNRVISIDAAQT
jgi:hypothetical protein